MMTPEQAKKRIDEWRTVESTQVWKDLLEGLSELHAVYFKVLRKSREDKKLYHAQGAMDIIYTVLNAKDNQVREAVAVIEGRSRTTARAARNG